MGSQVFTTPLDTAITWNWPVGVTQVTAEALGGGGGGGTASGNPASGGGGKGGSYSKKVITKGAEASLFVYVGAGGSPTYGNGAPSTIHNPNGTPVFVASGGRSASEASVNSTNGAGATLTSNTSIGDVTFAGGNGGTGNFTSGVQGSGAGGGAAGPGGVGGDASVNVAGTGNTSVAFADGNNYSGNGAAGVGNSTAGAAAPSGANSYGGGGSGGKANNNTNRIGGAGRQGIVVLTWTDPPAFAGDQAAFRFYEDGTESGATAIDAQNTNISKDLSLGDSNFALRVRVQETASGAGGLSTDNYQLYVSKNGGAYSAVKSLIDSYDFSNASFDVHGGAFDTIQTQSFTGNGLTIDSAAVRLKKEGTPTGNAVAKIYAHSGTYGTDSIPTGPALATSENFDVSTLSTSYSIVTFEFTGANRIVLSNGTKYVLGIEYNGNGGGNHIDFSVDGTSSAHPGNFATFSVSWSTSSNLDMLFEIISYLTSIVPYNSPNLTDQGTTTNRLGAGSGSFIAGQVSEDSDVTSFNLTPGNYTELLFSLTLKAALLSSGDTLDFKVYRNGSPLNAYTSVPRITATGSAPVQNSNFLAFF